MNNKSYSSYNKRKYKTKNQNGNMKTKAQIKYEKLFDKMALKLHGPNVKTYANTNESNE